QGEEVNLPVTPETLATARGAPLFYSEAHVRGVHLRLVTAPGRITNTGQRVAIQIARPMSEVDTSLRHLRLLLFAVILAGPGLAAVVGLGVARAGLAPVRRLTETLEQVTATGDLSPRIGV